MKLRCTKFFQYIPSIYEATNSRFKRIKRETVDRVRKWKSENKVATRGMVDFLFKYNFVVDK